MYMCIKPVYQSTSSHRTFVCSVCLFRSSCPKEVFACFIYTFVRRNIINQTVCMVTIYVCNIDDSSYNILYENCFKSRTAENLQRIIYRLIENSDYDIPIFGSQFSLALYNTRQQFLSRHIRLRSASLIRSVLFYQPR